MTKSKQVYMSKLHEFFLLLVCAQIVTSIDEPPISKPGCATKCGNLTVPYPFGIGLDGKCSLSDEYIVNCNASFNPPKPFIGRGNIEITNITYDGKMRIRSYLGVNCTSLKRNGTISHKSYINLGNFPLVFSDTDNKFTVVGCNTLALINGTQGRSFTSGCVAMCSSSSEVIDGSCTGIGCCQTSIPRGLKTFDTSITGAIANEPHIFNPCSYAFLAEESKFSFHVGDLAEYNTMFYDRTKENVPIVLEWYIPYTDDEIHIHSQITCAEARRDDFSYACQGNTNCTEFESGTSKGYRCNCLDGYQGNPYLSPGCTDIDECANFAMTNCSDRCTNTGGNYTCRCPKGYRGDGLKNGSRCTRESSQLGIKLGLGMSFGVLICTSLIILIRFSMGRKKIMKQREKYFEQNGGILLKQQLSLYDGSNDKKFKVYTSDELRVITNNYSQDRILGKGGYGIVHKGVLKDGSEVAVKTSKIVDQTQIEQFINEVVILTQINHCNVVKLLGCCLESEVPVLVYEYISNGTLFEHIHRVGGHYWLSWRNCVRLAAEAANALSYLHSAASPPIIHRDVKSSNILIDDSYAVKISDFGASRLIPIDQTRVITSVLGTCGYLDPEYLQTSQLTEKSDVYSFGVLLAELLTKKPPLCLERKLEDRNLAAYFLRAMKEDRLMEILDPELVHEASEEQLFDVAKLVKSCLNVKGDDRPIMREVAVRLEGLKNQISHSWGEPNYEESTSLLGQQDLYPESSSQFNVSTREASGLFNSMQKEMLIEMSSPR